MTTAKSFHTLVQARAITPNELLQSMEYYATGGWQLAASTVLMLVRRAGLSAKEREKMNSLALTGFLAQNRRRDAAAAEQYKLLMEGLRPKQNGFAQ